RGDGGDGDSSLGRPCPLRAEDEEEHPGGGDAGKTYPEEHGGDHAVGLAGVAQGLEGRVAVRRRARRVAVRANGGDSVLAEGGERSGGGRRRRLIPRGTAPPPRPRCTPARAKAAGAAAGAAAAGAAAAARSRDRGPRP